MVNILSVLLILSQFLTLSTSEPDFVYYTCDNTYGNYTSDSTYQQNLITLLTNISSNAQITYGFYNFSAGFDPDRVNGIGMCRGDVSLADCRSCLMDAASKIHDLCTNQKQAIGWYDNCMIRYTNRSIFRVMEDTPWFWIRNQFEALDQNEFTRVLHDLFGSLKNKAEAGNSTLKYAIGQANVSASLTLYAYTQCTPDLSQSDCGICLSDSISMLKNCCLPYQGTRFFRVSCDIRYEVYKFSNAFDAIASSPSKTTSSPPPISLATPARGKGSTTSKIVIVIVVVIVVCLLLIIVVCFRLRQQRREGNKANDEFGPDDEITSVETSQFTYEEIKDATQNFAEANKLGRGGFGTVYKGVLQNGQEIAVKKLERNSLQGKLEFRTEVQLLAKLQHRNLVRLLGFSLKGDERLLIYEFVPNASLDHFLSGETRQVSLDWNTRYKIVRGIARGLLYLHEDSRHRIIHRDLKASNILLDAHLTPKISDFGMARLFHNDQTHADTKQIAGTFGYMSPEYAYRGVFSFKSDVYSFGVLVLKIICGQKNSVIKEDDVMDDLITSVWRSWRKGTVSEVVDSTLLSASRVEIMRCIHIGLLCIQANPENRPMMSSVNLMLNSESLSLPVPSQPAYVVQGSLATDPQELNSVEKESITELSPR